MDDLEDASNELMLADEEEVRMMSSEGQGICQSHDRNTLAM